jgi:hypothetical protein
VVIDQKLAVWLCACAQHVTLMLEKDRNPFEPAVCFRDTSWRGLSLGAMIARNFAVPS